MWWVGPFSYLEVTMSIDDAASHLCATELGGHLLLLDSHRLRRAEAESFLSPWANKFGLHIDALDPDELGRTRSVPRDCRLVVINLGGSAYSSAEALPWRERLLSDAPATPMVLFSDRSDAADILDALHSGVKGYIPTTTSPDFALQALTFILNGGEFFPPTALLQAGHRAPSLPNGARERRAGEAADEARLELTPRQAAVLDQLKAGGSNKQIGRALNMCEATVKVHVRQIMRKLGVSNRTQAALAADLATRLELTSEDGADGPGGIAIGPGPSGLGLDMVVGSATGRAHEAFQAARSVPYAAR